MNPAASIFSPFPCRKSIGILTCLLLLGKNIATADAPLLIEHFDAPVADNSPIGMQPGWHALALNGSVTDYTTETVNGLYPSLAHNSTGAGTYGPGYLVMGAGNLVSNVLAWMDCPTNLDLRPGTAISFYTRNDSPQASERVAIHIANQWYASTQTFNVNDTNDAWVLNVFSFGREAGHWQPLKTNSLTLGPPLSRPLTNGPVSAIGFFGDSPGAAKIRIDELRIQAGSGMDPAYYVGDWIWAAKTMDRQTCRFWKTVEIPAGVAVTRARLRLTADNSYRAFFDGEEFAKGSEWRRLTEYDLTLVLTPGVHVLAVEAYNEFGWAGLVAGLVVEMDNNHVLEIPSNTSWRIVPEKEKGWTTRKTPRESWGVPRTIYHFRELPQMPRNPVVLLPSALHPTVMRFWQTGWFQLTLLSFCILVVAVCVHLLARLAIQSQAQHELQRERARIARDIHDELGAGLTNLVLMGETAQREPRTHETARPEFERVSDTGRRLLRSIDEVVWMINSQRDSLQDFEAYVCRYAENFLRGSSIHCRLHIDDEMPRATFDLATRRSFFLAVKETLNNIARHANATQVSLTIKLVAQEVHVIIEDNGRGFDFSRRDLVRNGLTNMGNRMQELGGRCEITSQPGAGCRVELAAPLKPRSQRTRHWLRKLFQRGPRPAPVKKISP